MRLRGTLLALAGAVAMLATTAGAASGATTTTTSSNWAGWAVHGKGATFTHVIGSWTVPSATCVAGRTSYSAAWVGIGGYSTGSDALEQIGTEVDCTAAGKARSSAWMELVPATSKTLSLKVSPGNAITASVTVKGHRVTLALKDTTNHRSYSRTVTDSDVDVSSAEWIVEAPSACSSSETCETLPLADFGSTTFAVAKATAATGHTGTISDSHWNATRISLRTGASAPPFVSNDTSQSAGTATASALSGGGSSFTVTYAAAGSSGTYEGARRGPRGVAR